MNKKFIWILLFACILGGGAFFRLWQLTDRPMHTDEAVHAEKFKALLQEGFYAYNPDEYHGPTLNYFTLVSTWLRGETNYSEVNEATLRMVPAVFGILLILTPLFFIRILGIRSVLFCAVLIAFSPAFVYYSRYYIQESLLLFFTACMLGCLYNYLNKPRLYWCVLSGLAIGLMHATKETFVFSIVAVSVALVIGISSRDIHPKVKLLHLICGIAVMLLTSMAFFSSFGSNPNGILDSIKTYLIWAQRAGGNSVHIHPWHFYLDLLTWLEFIEPVTWNEDGIVALAVIGLVLVFLKHGGRRYRCGRFLAIYTLVLTVIYSTIPYKTPWSMMSFVYGMALVAGFTADRIFRHVQSAAARIVFWILLSLYCLAAPLGQSWFLNFHFAADPANPYVYAHTTADIYTMAENVHRAVDASEEGEEVVIQVIASGDDYWPLPWYLKDSPNVGYWSEVDSSVGKATIILANAEMDQVLLDKLYLSSEPGQRQLYVPLFDHTLYLRPHVEWRGYITKDLWDRMNALQDSAEAEGPIVSKESFVDTQPDKEEIEDLVKFSHRAMYANFEIYIQDSRGSYAGRAARAAFNEVDRLERLLSRYIENSDVSRISALAGGEEAVVNEDTLQCLQISRRAWELTGGAFDITIGDVISVWKNGNNRAGIDLLRDRKGMKSLELYPEAFSVKVAEPLTLDLGGIGKGYAVDVIGRVLTEWGIERALIHGGASSVKALKAPIGKKGWLITLTNPIDQTVMTRLEISNEVFSSSGIQRGKHIFSPFTGRAVADRAGCWVRMKDNAALADALTTAGMILPIERLQRYQDGVPDVWWMVLLTPEGEPATLIKHGQWPKN